MKIYKRKGTPPIPIVEIMEALRTNKEVRGFGIRAIVRGNEEIIFVAPKPSASYDLIFDSNEKLTKN